MLCVLCCLTLTVQYEYIPPCSLFTTPFYFCLNSYYFPSFSLFFFPLGYHLHTSLSFLSYSVPPLPIFIIFRFDTIPTCQPFFLTLSSPSLSATLTPPFACPFRLYFLLPSPSSSCLPFFPIPYIHIYHPVLSSEFPSTAA